MVHPSALWGENNNRIFRGEARVEERIVSFVCERVCEWANLCNVESHNASLFLLLMSREGLPSRQGFSYWDSFGS